MQSETDYLNSRMNSNIHEAKRETIANYKRKGIDFDTAWSLEQSAFRFDDYEDFWNFWNYGVNYESNNR